MGQCTTAAQLKRGKLLSGDGSDSDSYDSEAKCQAKCDADDACFAYSWKVSYTDCKTYNRLDEVVDADLDEVVGVRSAYGNGGHVDAKCYVKRQGKSSSLHLHLRLHTHLHLHLHVHPNLKPTPTL